MGKSIDLNGIWDLRGIGENGESLSLKATVPGQVHLDLFREGIIPDMFYGKQAEECQWVENWIWEYEREFTVTKDVNLGDACIMLEGLDTFAEVIINGKKAGNTDNMYLPYSYSAKEFLIHGSNTICVRFQPCVKMVEDKPYKNYTTVFNQPERLFIRRMTCTFFWDWVNRFVTAGIWRPVSIICYERTHVEDLYVYTAHIGKSSASLNVSFEIKGQIEETDRILTEIIDPDENCVWSEESFVWDERIRLQADLENPRLWWPNGYGEHPIYTCRIRYYDENRKLLEETESKFGIRTVCLEQLIDQPGSKEEEFTDLVRSYCEDDKSAPMPGKGFTLLVNGERIFCKGGNWVPADPFPASISDEKYDRLIKLAQEGNINLLRSWGGGIYEPKAFFQACDRYGVMISQDFNMACGQYPEDHEDFVDAIRREVPVVVKQLRNHPSLVWWCGDNENSMGNDFDNPNNSGMIIYRQVFRDMMPVLDPSRPFRMTSPYGGRMNNCPTIGDCHRSWWMDYGSGAGNITDYKEFIKITGRFASECTLSGMPSVYSLRKFMSEEDITECNRDMMEYHTKNNPHVPKGYPTLYQMLENGAKRCLGDYTDGIDKARREGYVQYEWTRLTMEAARRNRWYTSGIQYWMYNDCWPAVGWSMVDYYETPKAAYYAMRKAAEPIAVSINDKMEAQGTKLQCFVLNDTLQPVEGNMKVWRVHTAKHTKELLVQHGFGCEANTNMIAVELDTSVWDIHPENETIIVCEAEGTFGYRRAFFHKGEPACMDFGTAQVQYRIENDMGSRTDTGTLIFASEGYARVVSIEGDVDVEDNYFDMLPGEVRTIRYQCRRNFKIKDSEIYWWNAGN